jgi:ABC-type transport system involved in cytochrome bd biosynthesis fused ATPase/permease subunit
VEWAVQKVHLTDYIKTLPSGIDTLLETSGNKLSKSIIQRVIIARNIVNRPKLLLLENHLDFIEENARTQIIDFLVDKSNGWTLISISTDHYLQQKSDFLVDMQNGTIL